MGRYVDSLLDINKAKKPSYGGENSTNREKKRETELAVLSVDGFAGTKGQDRREENICEDEGNDEKCDGDIGVAAIEKVAKAAVFSGDNEVGCGVYVKIVKKRRNTQGEGDNSINWEKKGEEDAIDNIGARKGEEKPVFLWVKREELTTNEGIDTQGQTIGAANASEVQNTKGSTKVHSNKRVEGKRRSIICESWAAVGSVEILHESLQVDGALVESVKPMKSEMRF
ncbi:hypothetical protein V8G54_034057 [Vigna mungo]|uniref:Uncharacterized protein n=1 Tax=Vigna mungo TaxID=3915 RepID=A0AAQ3MQG7_VIGMU